MMQQYDKTQSQTHLINFATALTSIVCLPENQKRVALIINPPATANRVSFALGEDAVDGAGIVIMPNIQPFVMRRPEYGEAMCDEIRGTALNVGTISITEFYVE